MIQSILTQINQSHKIGIISHDSPDGDAIGSSLALNQALIQMGKDSKFIVNKNINESYASLVQSQHNLKSNEFFDLLFVLDCSGFDRIKNISCHSLSNFIICIDHHTDNGKLMGDICWREPVQATGVLIYRLLKAIPNFEFSSYISTMLFLSIKTDTNNFTVFNPNFDIFKMASELIAYHADMNIIQELDKRNLSYVNLIRKTLPNLIYRDRIAYLIIDKIDIERCNSNYTEASRLIELLENIKEITVIYLIIKNGNKLSIKARSDEIDVCKIMRCYGGGGHKNAAGISKYYCKNIYKFIEELILKTKSIL